jgi:hypothetical protein
MSSRDRDIERRLNRILDRLAAGPSELDRRCADAHAAFQALCAEFGLVPTEAPPARWPQERRAWLYERLASGDAQRVARDDDDDYEPPGAAKEQ